MQAHITFACISIFLFILRVVWTITNSSTLERRWIKIAPHIIDSMLLACGVVMVIYSHQYPSQQPWLAAKLMALVLYIALGSITLKKTKSSQGTLFFASLAIFTFSYIALVAIGKSPYPFFY